jgi:hypothetical protein
MQEKYFSERELAFDNKREGGMANKLNTKRRTKVGLL